MQTNKVFYGCFHRNRSRTRKLINFERGQICYCLTSNPYERTDVAETYLKKEPKRMTRQYAEEIRRKFELNAINFKFKKKDQTIIFL